MAKSRVVKLMIFFVLSLIGALITSIPNALFNMYADYVMGGTAPDILAFLYIPSTVILLLIEVYLLALIFSFQLEYLSTASFAFSILLTKFLQLIFLSYFLYGIESIVYQMLIMPISFYRPGLIGIFYTIAYIGVLISLREKRYELMESFLDFFRNKK